MESFISLFLIVQLSFGQTNNIEKLVSDLSSGDFRRRHAAMLQLEARMSQPLYFHLQAQKAKPVSYEAKKRIDVLLQGYRDSTYSLCQVDLRGYPQYPWIDMEPFEVARKYYQEKGYHLLVFYLNKAEELGVPKGGYPDYADRRVATKIWVKERKDAVFAECLPKAKTQKELEVMIKEKFAPIEKDL